MKQLLMALDCEYTQPNNKTIEIGAVAFHPITGVVVDSFRMLVNPGEEISPYITDLTGISNTDVVGSVSIIEAYEALKQFHKTNNCSTNPVVWGSGIRNDSDLIYQEMLNAGGSRPQKNFMGFRVIDAKTIFQSYMLSSQVRSMKKSGLKNSLNALGLEFIGDPHGALADALNTARIWHYLSTHLAGALDPLTRPRRLTTEQE